MTSSKDRPAEEDRELSQVGRRKKPQPQKLAYSAGGMVSTAHYRATEAGMRVLADGGNAVDAAVAAAFALGVCEPQASGLGGQTLMLIHLAEENKTFALDGSSMSPSRATPESVPKKGMRLRGYQASTVPSTPAVLDYARREYGTQSLSSVVEPSVELAEGGFVVSDLLHSLMVRESKNLAGHSAGEVFLKGGRRPHAAGSTLRQPALASTFRRLASEGIEDFYIGEIGQRMAEDFASNEGLIHRDDLSRIPLPFVRKPVGTTFQGKRLRTFPPPGAGRVLVEMINIIDNFPLEKLDPETPDGALLLVEVMKKAAQDRQDRPFEANFYAQVTDRQMVDKEYAKVTAEKIGRRVKRKKPKAPPRTTGETTHLSVMDRFGNAVALTQSIERVFGSFCLTPELGFLYNNYMSAYEYDDIEHPYYLRPNTPPWGSVAPTILFSGRRPSLVIGSPGSERIVTAILQVLIRMASHTPFEAVAAPRLHCSYEGKVSLEASRFRDDIPRELARRGYEIDPRDPYSFYMGCVQMVMRDKKGFIGIADPRRDGSAGGPQE